MGIQAIINPDDLTAAGCEVLYAYTLDVSYGPEGDDPQEHRRYYAVVELPAGEVLHFNAYDVGSELWIDANHWGDNRNTHLAPLAALGVTWREV